MSIKCSTAVWQHSRLRGNALLCLLSIADRARDDGFAWPGIADIARRVRLSPRNVRRNVQKAQEAGELYVHARPGRNHQYLVLVGYYAHEIESALVRRFDLSDQEIEVFREDDSLRGAHVSEGIELSGGEDIPIPSSEDTAIPGVGIVVSPESLMNPIKNKQQENGEALVEKPKHEHLWEKYCETILSDVHGSSVFKDYLRGTRALRLEQGELVVGVPGEFQRFWLAERARATIERGLFGVANQTIQVSFVQA